MEIKILSSMNHLCTLSQHLKNIWKKKCRNKDYLEGKYWLCNSCSSQCWLRYLYYTQWSESGERGRRSLNGSVTESACEHEDEDKTGPPRVYCIFKATIRDCISNVSHTDQCAIFQGLCSLILIAQLLELMLNSLKGVYVLQKDDFIYNRWFVLM